MDEAFCKAARAAGISGPVRTLWSREDDMRAGYYRPFTVHRAEIGFDDTGRVLAALVGRVRTVREGFAALPRLPDDPAQLARWQAQAKGMALAPRDAEISAELGTLAFREEAAGGGTGS